ncbi:MAG: di-heme enzyme [Gemmatimonadales bacterium]|nr:MAG: di-heme enzyme [Gemmatimonadales bacterium]
MISRRPVKPRWGTAAGAGVPLILAAALPVWPGLLWGGLQQAAEQPTATPSDSWEWELPPWMPRPVVPQDNPMTQEKVELGRYLFYDQDLSANRTQSCASCHVQELSFADPRPRALGSTGEVHPRGSMSLANVAYASTLTWANPNLTTLEQQVLIPLFGEDPVELGMGGKEDELLDRLRTSAIYPDLFAAAFPEEEDPIRLQTLVWALASFQRALVSVSSPYDRYLQGDDDAVGAEVLRGEDLFFSERLECFHCHGGPFFSGSIDYEGKGFSEIEFFNNALYNVDGQGAYPSENTGIYEFTLDPADMGRFRAPSLKNIAVTAPYMHDGSLATLDDVLDHYEAGGRTIQHGPKAGSGRESPLRSEFIVGFELTPKERGDLLAFLHALTDDHFLTDRRFSDPWPDEGRLTTLSEPRSNP